MVLHKNKQTKKSCNLHAQASGRDLIWKRVIADAIREDKVLPGSGGLLTPRDQRLHERQRCRERMAM